MKYRTSKDHVETGGRNLPPSFQCWNPSCDHIHSYSTLAASFSDHTEPCLTLCTSVRKCTVHPMLLQVYGAQTHTVSTYASYAIAAYRIRHTRVTCMYALRVRMCVYVCECVYCTCVRAWCTCLSSACMHANLCGLSSLARANYHLACSGPQHSQRLLTYTCSHT